jgi:hypothetical protein
MAPRYGSNRPVEPDEGYMTFAHEHGDNPVQGRFRDMPAFGYPFKGRWND